MTLFLQGQPPGGLSDAEVYADETRLGDQAEPLGFDSLWSVEHHFTGYTMVPDVLQLLTWFAARTERIQLGSMVVVLPWHRPIRVAEQVAMLDLLSGGRLLFGVGRGLSRWEFAGMDVRMEDSRAYFNESVELLLEGLEKGYCEYDGTVVKQSRVDLRPAPARSFRGRIRAAANTEESMRVTAELGLGLLMIPQKPWDVLAAELEVYRSTYRERHSGEPPPPRFLGLVFCDEDGERAERLARRYMGNYWQTVIAHYDLFGAHLSRTRGYEYYADKYEAGADQMTELFLSLQVYGTPDRCLERIFDSARRIGADGFMGVFSYGQMPREEARRNLQLFARDVLPGLQKEGLQ
jgi:alkanesulfonate monooxygenase SsuD/methylene tetrahydromethanopterin reductase-like flavin-dependent oxidoreductase (luciferase family)